MRQTALGIVVIGLIASIAAPARAEEAGAARLADALKAVTFTVPSPAALAPAPRARALAQAPQAPTAPRRYSVSFGTDVPNDYFFRGFVQENSGFITQPFVGINVAASERVSVDVGWWNSVHSSETTGNYYETDIFATVSFAAGDWSPSVGYTWYISPNDSFGDIHELSFGLSHDSFIAPSVTLATEVQNDSTGNSGATYLELGIEPAIPLPPDTMFSLSVPVGLGLGLHDYFDEGFSYGFFKGGVAAGVDLGRGIEVHGGLDLLVLGDNIQFDDDRVKPVVSVGFSVTY